MSTDNYYEYKGYIISDNQKLGLWIISDSKTNFIGQFSTSEDAEDYIDNHIESIFRDNNSNLNLNVETNNLPIKTSTTRRLLETKYKDCSGTAYVLRSEYGSNKYACKNGKVNIVDEFSSPNLLIYKSANIARISRNYRYSNFGIEEVHIYNGVIIL